MCDIFTPDQELEKAFCLNSENTLQAVIFAPPHNQANAYLNMDNSSINKCPKPSWQCPIRLLDFSREASITFEMNKFNSIFFAEIQAQRQNNSGIYSKPETTFWPNISRTKSKTDKLNNWILQNFDKYLVDVKFHVWKWEVCSSMANIGYWRKKYLWRGNTKYNWQCLWNNNNNV